MVNMRKILIAMTILLTGCQTTNQSLNTASSGGKTTPQPSQSMNTSIYNRYKNKSNRYTQYQDGAPTKQKN